MKHRLAKRATFIASICLLTSISAGAAAAQHDPDRSAYINDVASWRADQTEHFTGHDGHTYDQAPDAVPGWQDELFFGAEFDYACAMGPSFVNTLEAMAKLTHIIEKSGRRALWTLGYTKPTVFPDRVDPQNLPHGSCDASGLRDYRQAARRFHDANYLQLADKLEYSRHPSYFKTDPHWSSVGASVFAKALATRLSRKLGKRQSYTYGTEQWPGMLNEMRGIHDPETAVTASPAVNVRVRTASGSDDYSGYPAFVFDHSWRSTPAKRTYPGHTLLIGDSFTMLALENLRPIFQHGRYMWYSHTDLDDVIDGIVDADTVVVEVYELFTAGVSITAPDFLHKLRRALRPSMTFAR